MGPGFLEREFMCIKCGAGTFENYSFRQDIGCNNEALLGVLGNRGKRTLRGTKANFEGNKDNIGEQGTKESKFSIFGEQGNKPIYFREQRNRYPLPPHSPSGRASTVKTRLSSAVRPVRPWPDHFFGQKRF